MHTIYISTIQRYRMYAHKKKIFMHTIYISTIQRYLMYAHKKKYLCTQYISLPYRDILCMHIKTCTWYRYITHRGVHNNPQISMHVLYIKYTTNKCTCIIYQIQGCMQVGGGYGQQDRLNYSTLLQNVVSFIGLFSKRDYIVHLYGYVHPYVICYIP